MLSPHSSDEEVENSDHGDADQDVQGPLDHRVVHVELSSGALTAAACGVYPAGVRHCGSGRRGGAGGFGHILRHGHEQPTDRNENRREKSEKSHFNIDEPAARNHRRKQTAGGSDLLTGAGEEPGFPDTRRVK